MAHVASVEAITGGGAFNGNAIEWNIGTLAAGANDSVTYEVILLGGASGFAAGSTDVANTAVLSADNQGAASASSAVSVAVAASTSTTSETTSTTDSPTTSTEPPATEPPATEPPATEPPTTTTLPATALLALTSMPLGMATLALAGTTKRRFFSRKKAARRHPKPPEWPSSL